MSTLARALEIAHEAHAGQVDKAGLPYIKHVLRVVDAVQTPAEKIVAALHDVLEDCPEWTIQRLADEDFGAPILMAVSYLTRKKIGSYKTYIWLVGQGSLSRAVKIADLRDNSDPARLALLPERDRTRLAKKYAAALEALGATPSAPPALGRT